MNMHWRDVLPREYYPTALDVVDDAQEGEMSIEDVLRSWWEGEHTSLRNPPDFAALAQQVEREAAEERARGLRPEWKPKKESTLAKRLHFLYLAFLMARCSFLTLRKAFGSKEKLYL